MVKEMAKEMKWIIRIVTCVLFFILVTIQSSRNWFVGQDFLEQNKKCDARNLDHVVIMESRYPKTGMFYSGTDHWFHLIENIEINLAHARTRIWGEGRNASSIYIIFQEKESTVQLSSFCCLMLGAVMSGGFFPVIYIGFTTSKLVSESRFQYTRDLKHKSLHFIETHKLQLSNYSNDYFQYTAHPSAPKEYLLCVSNSRVHNGYYRNTSDTYKWFSHNATSLTSQHYFFFRSAVHRMCGLTVDHKKPRHRSNREYTGINQLQLIKRRQLKDNNKDKYLFLAPPYLNETIYPLHFIPLLPSKKQFRKVIVYQRDKSRKLLNADAVRQRLEEVLNHPYRPVAPWTVDILTHSNSRHGCELINAMSEATVFITPHGFQSVLQLFQPLDSMLVEVHPFQYNKPGYFGLMSAALRNNLNLSRSYLYEESVVDNQVWLGFVSSFTEFFGSSVCGIGSSWRKVCRYIYKPQSVFMSEELIQKTGRVANKYFPIVLD